MSPTKIIVKTKIQSPKKNTIVSNEILEFDLLTENIKVSQERKLFECNECNKTFTQKVSLLRHKDNKHEGIRHPSRFCNYKATQENNLKKHITTIHSNINFTS